MRKKGLVLAGLIVLSLLVITAMLAGAQQNITVSIEDVSLYHGQQKNVSIMITNDTAQNVGSARINLTFNWNE